MRREQVFPRWMIASLFMGSLFIAGVCIASLFILGVAVTVSPAFASPDAGYYTCAPCGCPGDQEQHAEGGSCSSCGMALVFRSHDVKQTTEVNTPDAQRLRLKVAILVFPGVQIIDFTAPYEVFGQAGFEVYTVAEKSDELTTAMGMKLVPSYTLQNCPTPGIVVLPGGRVQDAQASQAVLGWIRTQAETAETILSVCNGAFILAETGFLNGLEATTFYGLIPTLETEAPKVRVVHDRRYVDNGKFITTAGLSSGIDGALHVVRKLLGQARAQRIALNMEYNWLDDVAYARADFADRMLLDQVVLSGSHLPYLDAPGTTWTVLDTRGDARHWQVEWRVEGGTTVTDLMSRFAAKLTEDAKWTRSDAPTASKAAQSSWQFEDAERRAWSGTLHVEPRDGALVVRLHVERRNDAG